MPFVYFPSRRRAGGGAAYYVAVVSSWSRAQEAWLDHASAEPLACTTPPTSRVPRPASRVPRPAFRVSPRFAKLTRRCAEGALSAPDSFFLDGVPCFTVRWILGRHHLPGLHSPISASTSSPGMQDDAGAKTVRVCLDERSHGTASLAYDKLAGFQAGMHLTTQVSAVVSAPVVL
jgi:hypothetical protein